MFKLMEGILASLIFNGLLFVNEFRESVSGQLNPNVISASVLSPLDRIKWPDRLKEHVNVLNRQIREEVTEGLIEGKG